MDEISLPSGAKLVITLPPFEVSKALLQAIAEEGKGVELDPGSPVAALWKDVFLTAIASPKIEACIWKCMERATYNGLKITKDTFENEDARDDYLTICYEVARKSILPFTKSLSAKYSQVLEALKNSLA